METPLAVGSTLRLARRLLPRDPRRARPHDPPRRVPARRHHPAAEGRGGRGGISRRGVAGAAAGGRRSPRVRARRRCRTSIRCRGSRDVFTGGPRIEGGKLVPPADQPGLGLTRERRRRGEVRRRLIYRTRCNAVGFPAYHYVTSLTPRSSPMPSNPEKRDPGTAPHAAAGAEAGRGVQDRRQARQPAVRLRPRAAQGRQDDDHRPRRQGPDARAGQGSRPAGRARDPRHRRRTRSARSTR